jgi:wyosine [tRNA(Phe)-imidazoG37] synthetase (radical SAM superfamily)
VFTFGPVNSRRFGLSLGIDLSPLKKSCNYDCVYCELESAKPVDSIENPPAVEEVIKEVKETLLNHDKIEVITITSNGEPTLYPYLDELVDELNKIKNDKKLLILSNGSTVCNKKIKDTLEKIDFVKLSLDCATWKCFKKIDRPLKDINLDKIISCMKDFKTTLIIEILLVKGINDKEKEIEAINTILQEIKPDRVDIGTIDRPPAYDVKKVEEDRVVELSKLIKNLPVSVIRKNPPTKKQDFTKDEILNLLSHRPQSQFDIDNFFSDIAKKNLFELYHDKKIAKKDIAGSVFYLKA